jgi:hypothetical protein
VRIGTWNLAGRWSPSRQEFLEQQVCDAWLLTEVPDAASLDGGKLVRSKAMLGPKSWAAVWGGQSLVPSPSAHPAAAVGRWGDLLLCSCVLPWRGARPSWPDEGPDIASITMTALEFLRPTVISAGHPVVWGGDWNHAMRGVEHAGTNAGRQAIQRLVADAGLKVATATAPHAVPGLWSIDHIAIPAAWQVESSRRLVAEVGGTRLSDHDAYIVDVVTA